MGNAFFCHGGDNKRTTTSARESTLYQKLTKGGRQKKLVFIGDMFPIGGGVEPPPAKKKSTFFRQNIKIVGMP